MKILKMMSIVLTIFIIQGCGSKGLTCPSYPVPNQHVLQSIQSIQDSQVDEWMLKQYKLNLKLKVCNED